jgi:hypothetical protein
MDHTNIRNSGFFSSLALRSQYFYKSFILNQNSSVSNWINALSKGVYEASRPDERHIKWSKLSERIRGFRNAGTREDCSLPKSTGGPSAIRVESWAAGWPIYSTGRCDSGSTTASPCVWASTSSKLMNLIEKKVQQLALNNVQWENSVLGIERAYLFSPS